MMKRHAQSKQSVQVVIADDSPHALRGLCAILATQPGIAIVGKASQGEEALALVEMQHPQVALLDVCMPVMNGLQATRAIKNRWPQIRVVLISMSADPQNNALESGADAFLVKGCPAQDLISTILGSNLTKAKSQQI